MTRRWIGGLWMMLSLVGPRDAHAQSRPTGRPDAGEVRGQLVDATSHQPVDAGVITVLRATDSVVASEARSADDGTFHVERLAVGRYFVRLRSLGFSPAVRDDVVVSRNHLVVDLGMISLVPVASQVAAQVVTAERADVTTTPDRTSYATKNMTAASGGTAVDVLRNVPSVEVDATNQVSLRGNQGVVVQINGRPSPLKGEQLGNFLAQLPASAVKRVEVSSNPSAKNDPDGTAGIINIVLNEDADIGWSGGWTAATGTTGQANASANVGHQGGPLTVFLSYGIYRNHQDTDGHSQLRNLQATVPALVTSHVDGTAEPIWQNSTFRAEYRVAAHDALSLDGTASGGTFLRDNISRSTDLDDVGTVIGRFNQANDQRTAYLTQDYALAYRHTGEANERAFSTQARFTETDGSISTMLSGDVLQGSAATGAGAIPTERDRSAVAWPAWSAQTDYTEPFGGATGTKLEAGLKVDGRRLSNGFTAAYQDSSSGAFLPVDARSNAFDYRERIGAAYALLTQQIAKLQAQAGLRVEQAATTLSLAGTQFDNHYASAFPSALVSYDLTATRQAKISYSRRITRPNPFQLDPVDYRVDARTAYRGNENLRPEYTDAFELGMQETRGWGSISVNPYARHTAHAVRTIQSVDSSGISIFTYDNVASTRERGNGCQLDDSRWTRDAHRRRQRIALQQRRDESAGRPLDARVRVVRAGERDLAGHPHRGRAGRNELSLGVRDGGRLAEGVRVHEPVGAEKAVERSRQHHASRAGSVQPADVRLCERKPTSDSIQRAELRHPRTVHRGDAELWPRLEAPSAGQFGDTAATDTARLIG